MDIQQSVTMRSDLMELFKKKEAPLVSVIIPVYNGEKTIERAVRSVLQNRSDEISIEILLIDDGSTDATSTICDRLARETGIHVFHTTNNGPAAARNLGLREASGRYIGFVDCDDWIEPDMYRKLLDALLAHEADIAACGVIHETGYGTFPEAGDGGEGVLEGGAIYREIIGSRGMRGYLWNKLFKRDTIISPLDESLLQCEDLLFCAQNLEGVRRAAYLSEPLYHYSRKAEGEELSLPRELSLADAQEKLFSLYTKKAPAFAYVFEQNLLKTYLHLRSRMLLHGKKDEVLLERVQSGIKALFPRMMWEKGVSLKAKGNMVFTYLLPRTSLWIKQRVLKIRHKNGIWES